MKKFDLGQATTFLANIGVLAGIIFLGIEIRQTRLAIQDTSHLGAIEYSVASSDRLFGDDFPSIYEKGLASYASLSPTEKRLFDLYVNQRMNLWEYAFWADQRGTLLNQGLPNYDAYFRTEMLNGAWQQIWEQRRTYQTDDFTTHVAAIISSE